MRKKRGKLVKGEEGKIWERAKKKSRGTERAHPFPTPDMSSSDAREDGGERLSEAF